MTSTLWGDSPIKQAWKYRSRQNKIEENETETQEDQLPLLKKQALKNAPLYTLHVDNDLEDTFKTCGAIQRPV